MQEEELTPEEVAKELKIHVRRVYQWIRSGELVATDLGTEARHNYRISRGDLNAFKEKRRTKKED